MNRNRIVCITKIPCDNNSCSNNPDSSSGIYMTAAMEAEFRAVTAYHRKQEEAKQN